MPRTLLALLLCSIIAACKPPADDLSSEPDRYQLMQRPTCDAFAGIDRSEIRDADANFPWLAKREQEAMTKARFDTVSRVDEPAIRVTEWGWGGSPSFYLVYMRANGDWVLRWRSEIDDEAHEKALPPEVAARLVGLLRQSCLYDEPAFLPAELPWKDAGSERCFDGSQTLMNITFEGRSRTSYQVCNRGGFTMEIRNQLFQEARKP